MFLMPEELGFLRYLKHAKVNIQTSWFWLFCMQIVICWFLGATERIRFFF